MSEEMKKIESFLKEHTNISNKDLETVKYLMTQYADWAKNAPENND